MSVDVEAPGCVPSVAGARESARRFLAGLVPALVPETADAVVLAVPELVTNALRHGGGAVVLNPAANADCVAVAVHDRSP